jgi:hypothetical protein
MESKLNNPAKDRADIINRAIIGHELTMLENKTNENNIYFINIVKISQMSLRYYKITL